MKAITLVTLAFGFLIAPLAVEAQQPGKVPVLGLLTRGSLPSEEQRQRSPFLTQLRELGWHEGYTIAIEGRYAEGNVERLPALAAELVRLHVDVIVTGGTPAALAAKQATSTIPIIMAGLAGNPVDNGLVASLARPEGNVTGVAGYDVEELWGKRLELLKEAVPKLSRLAHLWNPANPGNAAGLRAIQAVASAMGVQLQPLEVRDAKAFEDAFAEIAKEPPDAILIAQDDITVAHARPIADFAVRNRLPTLTGSRGFVQAGALMSYGPNLPGQWRRAAYYVDKILKGTKPADLPVERVMQFEFAINLKTAEALGLTIPPPLLFQATEVIR